MNNLEEFIPVTLHKVVKTCGNSCHVQIPRKYEGWTVTLLISKKGSIDKEISEHTELGYDIS